MSDHEASGPGRKFEDSLTATQTEAARDWNEHRAEPVSGADRRDEPQAKRNKLWGKVAALAGVVLAATGIAAAKLEIDQQAVLQELQNRGYNALVVGQDIDHPQEGISVVEQSVNGLNMVELFLQQHEQESLSGDIYITLCLTKDDQEVFAVRGKTISLSDPRKARAVVKELKDQLSRYVGDKKVAVKGEVTIDQTWTRGDAKGGVYEFKVSSGLNLDGGYEAVPVPQNQRAAAKVQLAAFKPNETHASAKGVQVPKPGYETVRVSAKPVGSQLASNLFQGTEFPEGLDVTFVGNYLKGGVDRLSYAAPVVYTPLSDLNAKKRWNQAVTDKGAYDFVLRNFGSKLPSDSYQSMMKVIAEQMFAK